MRRKESNYINLPFNLLPFEVVATVWYYFDSQFLSLPFGRYCFFYCSEATFAQQNIFEDEVLLLFSLQGLRYNQLYFLFHNIYYTCSAKLQEIQATYALSSNPNKYQRIFTYVHKQFKRYFMQAHTLPVYQVVEDGDYQGNAYFVLTPHEHEQVPEDLREVFVKDHHATHTHGKHTTIYLTPEKAAKTTISSDVRVSVSAGSAALPDYLGLITDFLTSPYKFNRKSKRPTPPTISLLSSVPQVHHLVALSSTRNQTREWGNGRGDVEGTPQFFTAIAEAFGKQHEEVKVTTIIGDDLLKEGFRLLHAVGRASVNKPAFVNLAYRGDPDSEDWLAYVGKGVCFDTGGLDIKTASGMLHMFLDKCGAVTVLSAFQTIVRQKVKVNLTCSIGLVQNSINENAYRPSDIITSRKGLTVEIGNTDAEGRLVLADCMHWTQQHFKVRVLIELSTLTGAVIVALGSAFTGLFTNDEPLAASLRQVGERIHEYSWHMPCTDYHKNLVSPKHCDLTNSSGKTEAGSSQAAAFLRSFVEEGVKWAHLDVAGTAMIAGDASGWGSRLLVEYAHSVARKTEST